GNSRLYGLNPTTGAQVIALSGVAVTHLNTPAVGGGRVVVPGGTQVEAFNVTTTGPGDNQASVYSLDGYGGVHPQGAAPPLGIADYWPGFDIARALALTPDGAGGEVL